MTKPCLFLLAAVLLLAAACSMDMNLNGGNDTVYGDSCCWMGKMDPDTPVRDITVPATHDSCANYDFLGLSSISSTQDLTLAEQLEAGVRCIDIRIHEKGSGWGVFHGPVYLNMMLEDVVAVCRDFLERNPSEFIILMSQYENGYHRLATYAVAQLRASDTELFYQEDGYTFRTAKLSDLAGKIVPALNYLRIYGEPDLVSERDFWVPDDEDLDEEDYWETENPQEILEYSLCMIENYSSGNVSYPSLPGIITTSSHFRGQFGLPNYRIVSSVVNPALQKWFGERKGTGTGYGIIRTDHMTRDLSHAIYSTNVLSD